MTKYDIYKQLEIMKAENIKTASSLTKTVSVKDYENLVKNGIWTEAFRRAILEGEVITIPKSNEPYLIDNTIIIPSNRRIEAEEGAVIRQAEGVGVIMFRNEHTADGTHAPIAAEKRDYNISINGGRWEESYTSRKGYRQSGRYDDDENHFFGVSTCMLFNNIDNLTLTNMTFYHTAGFAVQTGDITNGVFENIEFCQCFADGIHINGNTKNIFIRNIKGQVGDDLVALNMYDWQNSSIDFGPGENILCENLELAGDSRCKGMRIEPGVYYYDDGSTVDCSLKNTYIKNVSGVNTFKLYFQTPPYYIGSDPERGDAGTVDNVYFEDIDINLNSPVDRFDEYLNADPVRGTFAAFELGSKIGRINFENINVTIDKEKYPMSYFLCIGPKSILRTTDGKATEIFDPYISSHAEELYMTNVKINGKSDWEKDFGIKEISFEDVDCDGNSTAKGVIHNIIRK